MAILEALNNILNYGNQKAIDGTNPYTAIVEKAGGVDKLEELQSHNNYTVYKKSVDILETYFNAESDDEKNDEDLNFDDQNFNFQGFGSAQ